MTSLVSTWLIEDEAKLRRWWVCGLEIGRIAKEFEGSSAISKDDDLIYKHYETSQEFKTDFKTILQSLIRGWSFMT